MSGKQLGVVRGSEPAAERQAAAGGGRWRQVGGDSLALAATCSTTYPAFTRSRIHSTAPGLKRSRMKGASGDSSLPWVRCSLEPRVLNGFRPGIPIAASAETKLLATYLTGQLGRTIPGSGRIGTRSSPTLAGTPVVSDSVLSGSVGPCSPVADPGRPETRTECLESRLRHSETRHDQGREQTGDSPPFRVTADATSAKNAY